MSFLQIPIQTYPNTALGYQSSISTNTNAVQNTGFGFETLKSNSEGDRNSAFGHLSLTSVNGINAFGNGSGNSGFGYRTLFSLTTGNGNSAFGAQALRSTNGSNSTAYGALAGQNSTGQTNSFFGYASGQDMTTGSENVIIGSFNGNNYGLDIRTLSNHIVLSDGLGVPRLWINNTGAVNIPGGIALTGSLSITGGTVTANNPVLSATQTWNNAAVTFTGWQLNVTDIASSGASLLMDLQVGGVSRISFSKGVQPAGGLIAFGATQAQIIANNSIGIQIKWVNSFVAVDSAGVQINTSGSAYLATDASNILAQRNGVNAQTLRVYNTFTDASNYERGALQWQSNELQLRVDGAGTGQNRALQIVVGNQVVAYFNSAGNRSVALGAGAVATNATSGFVYVPTCAGLPTGTPETYTGRAAIVIDTTNNKLYFYSGGAWRDAGP